MVTVCTRLPWHCLGGKKCNQRHSFTPLFPGPYHARSNQIDIVAKEAESSSDAESKVTNLKSGHVVKCNLCSTHVTSRLHLKTENRHNSCLISVHHYTPTCYGTSIIDLILTLSDNNIVRQQQNSILTVCCIYLHVHVCIFNLRLTDYTRDCNIFIIFHAWYQNTSVLYCMACHVFSFL